MWLLKGIEEIKRNEIIIYQVKKNKVQNNMTCMLSVHKMEMLYMILLFALGEKVVYKRLSMHRAQEDLQKVLTLYNELGTGS